MVNVICLPKIKTADSAHMELPPGPFLQFLHVGLHGYMYKATCRDHVQLEAYDTSWHSW